MKCLARFRRLGYPSMEKQKKEGNRRVSFDLGKELESPRFRAIIRATSGRKKGGDVKGFSHELNCKGHHQLPVSRLRGIPNLDELTDVIRVKFSQLKEEVNAELCKYGGDLISTMERIPGDHPDRIQLEDLLVTAQKCEAMSVDELWVKCEGIVQSLDDRRQELPIGPLKQAHTRILFILTRCTRLLQTLKEGAFGEDEHVLALHQTHKGDDIKERLIRRRTIDIRHQSVDSLGRPLGPYLPEKDGLSPGSRDRISSWKKPLSAAENKQRKDESSPTKKVLDSTENQIAERIAGGDAFVGYGDDQQGVAVGERQRMVSRRISPFCLFLVSLYVSSLVLFCFEKYSKFHA